MNRKSLLDALRKAGYTGAVELDAIKKWLTERGEDAENIAGPDGQQHKLSDVFGKTTALKMAAVEEPEAEEVDEPEVEKKAAPEPKKKGAGFKAFGAAALETPSRSDLDKKQYDLKIKRGEAVYGDADQAEIAGAWFRKAAASCGGRNDYPQRANDEKILAKASSTFVNASAGALVPPDFVAQVIYLTEKFGVATRIANVRTMTRDVQTFPRRTGVQALSALGEGATITGTDDTYDNVEITAKKFGRLALFSNELLDDSAVSVADEFTRSTAEAWQKSIDLSYFIGDGTSTYNGQVGLIGALPSGAYVAQASGSTWGAQTMADLENMIGRVENVDSSRLAWVCSRQYYYQVMVRLAMAQGGVTVQETVAGMNGGAGNADAMFLGFPVYFTQVLPTATATSQKCVYFGDFMGASMVGLRKELQVASSTDRYFDADQFAMRAIARFAINIHGDGRATTYGPVTALKTS